MKTLLSIFFISIFFFACSNSQHSKLSKLQMRNDTIYVSIDSSTMNKSDNTFDWVLYYDREGEKHEVHREKNRDYGVEFDSLPFLFKHGNLNIEEFAIHDLPTGRDKSVIYNKKSHTFYLTDWYNNSAMTDTLQLSTLDFESDSISVKNSDAAYSDYRVKFQKIWP